jgi:inner membrane transporter RhtA
VQGLAVSLPVAALVATLASGPPHGMTPELALTGLGLALLNPVVPFSLEMFALRRLTTAAFGTLMCLEPAVALLAGLALLHQVPGPWSLAGVALVVVAGIGAERTGARDYHEPDDTDAGRSRGRVRLDGAGAHPGLPPGAAPLSEPRDTAGAGGGRR